MTYAGWCERENRIQMKALTRLGPVARRIIQAISRYWGPRGKNKVLHKLFKEKVFETQFLEGFKI